MKQTRYEQLQSYEEKLAFDRIPDEILIRILTQPVIDLTTLGIIKNVSGRMYQLTMRVFSRYRLPAIEMALTIDQEGKSRVTNRFEFSHFCDMTFNAVFVNVQPTPKRYYTNKAYPVIRLMSMEDYYSCDKFTINDHDPAQLQHEIPSLPISSSSSFTLVQLDDDDEKTLRPSQKRSHSNDSIPSTQQQVAMTTESNTKVQNYKIQAQKEGLHMLQGTPPLQTLQSRIFMAHGRASWKMAYQISNRERQEYYLTPINFYIRLEQLIRFEQKANPKHANKRQSGMNRMINWIYQL